MLKNIIMTTEFKLYGVTDGTKLIPFSESREQDCFEWTLVFVAILTPNISTVPDIWVKKKKLEKVKHSSQEATEETLNQYKDAISTKWKLIEDSFIF